MSKIQNYFLPEEHMKMLNRLLKVVITVLKKNNITWWADGGTLLGAIRNKGQIKWDDDCDIGIMEKDMEIIPKIAHHFISFGYGVKKVNDYLWKIYIPMQETWIRTEYNCIGTPTIDIFSWKIENNKIVLSDPNFQKEWPNCYHKMEDFMPLKEYPFNDHSVMGVNNPIPYLDRMYKNWTKLAVIEIREIDEQFNTKKVRSISFPLKAHHQP